MQYVTRIVDQEIDRKTAVLCSGSRRLAEMSVNKG